MTQYKTIAGPVGLVVEGNEGYEGAVRKYAALIDQEAVGGWELLLIQQVPVTKKKLNVVAFLFVAILFAAIGYAIGSTLGGRGDDFTILGGIVGLGLGVLIGLQIKTATYEIFNMLVFALKQ
ncbi:MAG: hypothetical protein FWG98_03290 [Candidatus Cloacimonetes bacterium]|nr:hypothetical protein [Candidatus Cloacimonadota bacterium]